MLPGLMHEIEINNISLVTFVLRMNISLSAIDAACRAFFRHDERKWTGEVSTEKIGF
jgi:hypothetical protein